MAQQQPDRIGIGAFAQPDFGDLCSIIYSRITMAES